MSNVKRFAVGLVEAGEVFLDRRQAMMDYLLETIFRLVSDFKGFAVSMVEPCNVLLNRP